MFLYGKLALFFAKIFRNCCQLSCSFWTKYALNCLSNRALAQTPPRELTALIGLPSWFRGRGPREREGKKGKNNGREI